MHLSKALISLTLNDERVLRLTSYLASIGSLLLLPYVGARLFKTSLPTLALLFVFALHPGLVDYAKEFKPYSVEVFLHLGLIALFLRYRQTNTRVALSLLLGSTFVSFFFAYTIALIYPAVLLLLAVGEWRAKRWKRLGSVVSCTIGLLVMMVVANATLFSWHVKGRTDTAWGKKLDSFYIEKKTATSWRDSEFVWTVERYLDQATMPGWGRKDWKQPDSLPVPVARLRKADYLFWAIAHVLGLLVLAARRRWLELGLLGIPLLAEVALNVARKWPLGDLRMNVFTIVYTAPVALMLLDLAWTNGKRWVSLSIRSVAVGWLVLTFLFVKPPEPSVKHKPAFHTEMNRVLEAMHAQMQKHDLKNRREKPIPLFRDDYSICPVAYHFEYRTLSLRQYGDYFRKTFQPQKFGRRKHLAKGERAWILTSDPRTKSSAKNWVQRNTKVLFKADFPPSQQLFFVERK